MANGTELGGCLPRNLHALGYHSFELGIAEPLSLFIHEVAELVDVHT